MKETTGAVKGIVQTKKHEGGHHEADTFTVLIVAKRHQDLDEKET